MGTGFLFICVSLPLLPDCDAEKLARGNSYLLVLHLLFTVTLRNQRPILSVTPEFTPARPPLS